jgi:hypothetical protein
MKTTDVTISCNHLLLTIKNQEEKWKVNKKEQNQDGGLQQCRPNGNVKLPAKVDVPLTNRVLPMNGARTKQELPVKKAGRYLDLNENQAETKEER